MILAWQERWKCYTRRPSTATDITKKLTSFYKHFDAAEAKKEH
jgi:hypothetical protein